MPYTIAVRNIKFKNPLSKTSNLNAKSEEPVAISKDIAKREKITERVVTKTIIS